MNAVTGVFSYTGTYIARRLLADGERLRTLSREPDPTHELAGEVEFARLQFGDERALTESLRDVDTLYNTYWIRFPRGRTTWDDVLENTRTLLRAARTAGVRRFVHVSVTNPSLDDRLGYYRYKARAEALVREAGIEYGIVRPTLIFAREDILLNNIAWVLRTFPLFVIAGDGRYRVQPVAAGDVAAACVDVARAGDTREVDVAGPEIYSYGELVEMIRSAVGSKSRVVHASPAVTVALGKVAGILKHDTLLTREELDGLMHDKLVSGAEPTATSSFAEWLGGYADGIGRTYQSELKRNWR